MNIEIVQRRWRDIQAGDIIRDPSWVAPRWVTIQHIENIEGRTAVWTEGNWREGVDRADQQRPLSVNPLNLVEVQVEA